MNKSNFERVLEEARRRYSRDYLEATQGGRRAFGVRVPNFAEYRQKVLEEAAREAGEVAREVLESPGAEDAEFLSACGVKW